MPRLILFVVCVFAFATYAYAREHYSPDGTGNNPDNVNLGKTGNNYIRQFEANYEDGVSVPIERGNERIISNALFRGTDMPFPQRRYPDAIYTTPSSKGVSLMLPVFGQFVQHDVDHSRTVFNPATGKYVPLPDGDDAWDAVRNDEYYIFMSRTDAGVDPSTGQYEVPADTTHYFDLSQVYGSDIVTQNTLRSFADGKLLVDTLVYSPPVPPGVPPPTFHYANMPPLVSTTGLPIDTFFLPGIAEGSTAGDDRVNENVGLFLIHTHYLREHNHFCDELKAANPTWTDEQLFQAARDKNIAVYQSQVYNEYLPALFGEDVLVNYTGYDASVNPETSIEFASLAQRYGHTEVAMPEFTGADSCPDDYVIPPGAFGVRPDGTLIPSEPVILADIQFAGQLGGNFDAKVTFGLGGGPIGVENTLRAFLRGRADELDIQFNEAIRSVLNVAPIGPVVDLACFDLFRGREHGIADYIDIRSEFYADRNIPPGLRRVASRIYGGPNCSANRYHPLDQDPIECFLMINSNQEIATALQSIYGKVINIDPIVGLLVEDKPEGALFPRTLQGIIFAEYERKSTGDHLFYLVPGRWSQSEIAEIESRTLGIAMGESFPGVQVQENVFSTDNLPVCSQTSPYKRSAMDNGDTSSMRQYPVHENDNETILFASE